MLTVCLAWDTASLTFLDHLPYYYLLKLCYDVRPTTIANSIGIDVLSMMIPFYFLGQLSVPNNSEAPKSAVANRPVIKDGGVRLFTSLAAAGVYSLVIYVSLRTWLPLFMVTRFDGLRDLNEVHNADFAAIVLGCLFNGFAAKNFIFTPAMASKPDTQDARNAAFNPATATFGETLAWNLWGYSKRTRTLIQKTFAVAFATFCQSALRIWLVVEGAEASGAAGWAATWSLGAVMTGVLFYWIGDMEE